MSNIDMDNHNHHALCHHARAMTCASDQEILLLLIHASRRLDAAWRLLQPQKESYYCVTTTVVKIKAIPINPESKKNFVVPLIPYQASPNFVVIRQVGERPSP